MKRGALTFLLVISCVSAADYYVAPDGSASWSECTSIDAPCSLNTANSNAQAGDTVFLRGGVYNQYIEPDNSGIPGSRLVFTNYEDENASIEGTNYGVRLDGNSYVAVDGINSYYLGHFLYIINGHHNVISNCRFNQARDPGVWGGGKVYRTSTYNHIVNCTFAKWGRNGETPGENDGAMLDIGNEHVTDDDSFYNLIEGNHFYHAGHHALAPWSKFSVFRNNYLHNEPWGPDNMGYRNAITHGQATGWNLIEGNRFAFADGSSFGLRSSNNIFRFNMFYNNELGALQIVGMNGVTPTIDNLVYNNIFYNNGHGADYDPFSGGVYFADWNNAGPLTGNEFKNNIFYDNKGGAFTYDSDVPERISVIENNYEGDPGFVSDMSVSYTPFGPRPDFNLIQGSPCIDAGGPLTAVISPAGSGTTFTVGNPWYFYDGWTIPGEVGDMIQLEGSSEQARIVDVDYDTGDITVDKDLSWAENQGIGLAFYGAGPDIGAFEYENVTCETTSDCPDRACNQKSCASSSCAYTPLDGVACNGVCGVCSNGFCSDNSSLCGAGEICSSGQCIADPGCLALTQLQGLVAEWKLGALSITELMNSIVAWKAC